MLFAAVTGWATHTMMMTTMMTMTVKHHFFQPYHFFVGTPLAWWLLAWRGHLPDTHPNHGHPGNLFAASPSNCLSHSHSHISSTLKLVSLHLEMQLAITSTSGTEKSRQLPPTLHCCYQCLSTACWSTDPVPAAPFVQGSLRQPYQIRRLFPLLACTSCLLLFL